MPLVGAVLGQGPMAGSSLATTLSAATVPMALAAAFTATGLLLHKLRRKFIFVDYVHAEK
jgi:hypothetical protein